MLNFQGRHFVIASNFAFDCWTGSHRYSGITGPRRKDSVSRAGNWSKLLQRKTSVKEFFEMMLGFPVRLQTSLYKFFTVTEATILTKANMLSKCDGINILELGAGQIVGRKKFHRLTSPYSTAAPLYCAIIELHTFEFDQGMSWKLAHDTSASLSGNSEGFYVSNLV
jgi:hypothetical protein